MFQVNILDYTDFKQLEISDNELTKTATILSSYTGHKIEVCGKISLNCSFNGHNGKFLFYVLKSKNASSILGLQAASELKVINPEKTQKKICENDRH
ncbi:hypothetical protein NQ314_008599 [Rhamnusium bicolor]|uniref:Uncharacterized protein n=1 Tax=Rhamnusium bicolor TaxID=1586634 RepID=A0AAV8Y8X7_9CUCU|nr:hypothetical protein NQ314_008599 [Rhamnusium bicolor]